MPLIYGQHFTKYFLIQHFIWSFPQIYEDFPDSSVGKESTCNAGDPGLIPGLGRSSGEGIGYPLQCFSASLVAQLVKNLSVMQETWIRFLGWEEPLEEGKATHSSILTWRIPWTVQSMKSQKLRHDRAIFTLPAILFKQYEFLHDADKCFI